MPLPNSRRTSHGRIIVTCGVDGMRLLISRLGKFQLQVQF